MKALTLLLCFLLVSCEQRVADLEMQKFREFIGSEEGRKRIANCLAGIEVQMKPACPRALDELVPIENWRIKRMVSPTYNFLVFVEEKESLKGWYFAIVFEGDQAGFSVSDFPAIRSEFENLGDPISREMADAFFRARRVRGLW